MDSLKGKTLFISGGSRGIGLAIALRAARDGAHIVIAAKTDTPNPKLPGTIHTAVEEIEKAGRKGTFVFKHVMGKANYADVLCDFAYEKQADVLVVGHGGQSAKKRPPRAGEHTPTPASRRPSSLGCVDHTVGLWVADGSGKLVRTQTGPRLGSVTERCASEAHCALLITKGSGRWSMGADHALQKAHR